MILRGVLSGLKTDIVDEIQRARVVVVVVYRRIDRVPCLASRVQFQVRLPLAQVKRLKLT